MSYDNIYAKGSTSVITQIMIRDSSSGQGKTGLTNATVTAYYIRPVLSGTSTVISLSAGVVGDAYSSGKFAEVDATNQPGVYQVHLPNACFATGANVVDISYKASGTFDKRQKLSLVDVDLRVATGKLPVTVAAGDAVDCATTKANMPVLSASINGSIHTLSSGISQPGGVKLPDGVILCGTFGATAITKIQLGLAVPGSQMDLVNVPNATALAAVKTALTLPTGVKKNVALSNFTFPMFLSSDHATLATGKTVTGTIRKDAGAFAALTNAVSEVAATGMYTVNLTQTEMNASAIDLVFVATGCDALPILIITNA